MESFLLSIPMIIGFVLFVHCILKKQLPTYVYIISGFVFNAIAQIILKNIN